jgi:very-short-patch-repair endonuclease
VGIIRNHRRILQRDRARALRARQTDAEAALWAALRAARLGGWKWKRQVPFDPYILDFLCRDAALVVEVDGGVHETQADHDTHRTARLQRAGLRVLRFPNEAVLKRRDDVCAEILKACGGRKRF